MYYIYCLCWLSGYHSNQHFLNIIFLNIIFLNIIFLNIIRPKQEPVHTSLNSPVK